MPIENAIIKDLIKVSRDDFIDMSIDDFLTSEGKAKNKEEFPVRYQNAIPLGTIPFVTLFLNIFKGIEKMNPIEVPNCLRTDEFLKRKYSIVEGRNVPKEGNYFVKNVSNLKSFTHWGSVDRLFLSPDAITGKNIIKDDELYQVSEIIDIISEYRVYFIDGKVYDIAYYNGHPCVFPDTALIEKANLIYSLQKDYPKSYTMDVAVNKEGTCIIEVHPMFSCGIYSTVLGPNFLGGYFDSMKYVTQYNTPISLFSNFGSYKR
jgi:hypothetical protein